MEIENDIVKILDPYSYKTRQVLSDKKGYTKITFNDVIKFDYSDYKVDTIEVDDGLVVTTLVEKNGITYIISQVLFKKQE